MEFPDILVTMLMELPSVGGLAFAVWTLSRSLSTTLDIIERLATNQRVIEGFSGERSGASPEENP